MSTTIFNAALTGAFVASKPTQLVNEELTLDFTLVTTGGPTTVNWFPEFSEDLKNWFREVAEEDAGKGVISMPKAVRTFADNGGTQLSDGTHLLSVQLVRQKPFARIQIEVTAGAATAQVNAVNGAGVNPPQLA